jgi:hypothetical protein
MAQTFRGEKIADDTILAKTRLETSTYTGGAQVKLSPTQLEALKSICKEHNFNASTFLREAIDTYIDIFPYRSKLKRHRRLLRALVDKLS